MRTLPFVVGFLTLIFLFSCGKQKEVPHSSADSVSVADSAKTDSIREKNVTEAGLPVPAWYRNIPQKKDMIYATGLGRSLRPNLARDKAVLQAQRSLAHKIEILSSSGSIEAKEETHSGAQEESPGEGTLLNKARIAKQKQIKKGKFWYAYVLLQMPVSGE